MYTLTNILTVVTKLNSLSYKALTITISAVMYYLQKDSVHVDPSCLQGKDIT